MVLIQLRITQEVSLEDTVSFLKPEESLNEDYWVRRHIQTLALS